MGPQKGRTVQLLDTTMTLEEYDLQNIIAITIAVAAVLAMIAFNGMDDGDVA